MVTMRIEKKTTLGYIIGVEDLLNSFVNCIFTDECLTGIQS